MNMVQELEADVLVVGGGPAGLQTARRLAEEGVSVLVLEEHSVIGEPVDCCGVIGIDSFSQLGLPQDPVLGQLSVLRFVSPGGCQLMYRDGGPLAYVTDRGRFDQTLAALATAAGVRLETGVKVVDLRVSTDGVEAKVRRNGAIGCREGSPAEIMRARAAVIAVGPQYNVQRFFGMGRPHRLLRAAHAEVRGNGYREPTVYFGAGEGKFAWVLPTTRGREHFLRVGAAGGEAPREDLSELMEELRADHFEEDCPEVRQWVIPMSPIRRTYADRLVAVGDAAGQVKPTSGGGIYYGMLSGEAAAEVLVEGVRRDDLGAGFLSRYERAWRGRVGPEIRAGRLFRRIFERLTGGEIDRVFRVLSAGGVLEEVAEEARFDWHRGIIMAMLRHPRLSGLLLRRAFWRR